MATPGFLLNRYQRTLGNKPRLLQRRIAIEKDIEDKKYAADIALMNQAIKLTGGAVGTGVDYMLAKKGGYTEGFKAFLEEKMKEKQGGNTTYAMNEDGTMSPSSRGGVIDPTKSYRTFMEAGRKQVGEDIKKGWENVKGLMPTKDSFSKMFEKSSDVKTPTWLHEKITGDADSDKYSPQPALQSGKALPTEEEQRNEIKAEEQRRAVLEAFKEKPNRSTRYDGSSRNTSSQQLSDFNTSPIETYYPDYSKYGIKSDEEFNYDLYKPRVKSGGWGTMWQRKAGGK